MLNVRPARARSAAPVADAPARRAAEARPTRYVVLDAVPALGPRAEARRRRPAARAPARRERRGWAAPTATALACLLATAAVSARAELVRAWPEAAMLFAAAGLPVNLVGATLSDVTAAVAPEDGGGLLVTGRIAGAAARTVALPPLEASLRNGAGEVVRRWTIAPPRPELAPGEEATFEARLATLPADARRVRVTFAHRGTAERAPAAVASRRF